MNQSNLKKLQNLLKEKDIDIFVINRSDEYLNEYISPNAERLNFITNFSGSAGRAIITPTDAFLYVDGRYTFQANTQINAKEIQAKHLNSFWTDLEKILLEEEYKIALDPTLHSIIEIEKVEKILENSKSQLQLIDKNFVDLIWENQPKTQYTDIFDHPTSFAGQGRSEKLDILKKFLDQNEIDHYFVSGLDNIAWLLNLRADDIKYTPLLYSYLLISKNNKHSLYIKESSMPEILKKEIQTLININNIENGLKDCNIHLFIVPSTKEIRHFLFDSHGIDKITSGSIIVDLTTSNPEESIKLAEELKVYNIDYLDCGMTGGAQGAANGTLTLMIGGEKDTIQKAKSILESFTNKLVHVGKTGSGHAMKLIHNMVTHTIFFATVEGVRGAKELGIDPNIVIDVFNSGNARSFI